ncbi:WD40 repeat [Dillenia turbinata]|uniref:WD40 repeat n=1 Tax=Dillenia turbinata TaxID=194707 RepID=A0AAN8VG41_9MAGN
MYSRTRSKGFGNGFSEICRREIGFSNPSRYSRQFSSSEVIVQKIDLYGKLNGHEGCVNTVEFNSSGDLLLSGSDDRQVIFWNWQTKSKKFSYPSGHIDNIFQAKVVAFSDDRKIITSSGDGQVRLGQVLENGQVETKRLGKHHGHVYKIAMEPGNPNVLYSCGGDGFIQRFDLRSDSATKLFYCTSLAENKKQAHNSIRLNAIVIDPRNFNYLAAGGSDEYVRVYDMRYCPWYGTNDADRPVDTFCPRQLVETGNVHITGLAYSKTNELLVSYNDELIYLFQKNMGMGPSPLPVSPERLQTMEDPQVYSGHRNSQTVKGVGFFGPNDEYVISGSDCGHIFIWKKKDGKLVRVMVGDRHIVNQLEPHPHLPILATCGLEKSVKLWVPNATIHPLPTDVDKIIKSNRQGREDHSRLTLTPDVIMHVLRLQRRQTLAYIERRYNIDIESDEDEEAETYVLGFSDGEGSSDEGFMGNSNDCNIN